MSNNYYFLKYLLFNDQNNFVVVENRNNQSKVEYYDNLKIKTTTLIIFYKTIYTF